ncbi:hypothetical protein D3C75_823310 [compost metagenome]
MEAVNILLHSDSINDRFLLNMLRKRQLDKNSVNVVTAVQISHKREQLFLASRSSQSVHFGMEAQFYAGFLFIADIDLRSRIFTDKHDSKTGLHAAFGQLFNLLGNVNTNFV